MVVFTALCVVNSRQNLRSILGLGSTGILQAQGDSEWGRLGWTLSVPWFLSDSVGFVLSEGDCDSRDREGLAVAPGWEEEIWLLHVSGAQQER